MKENAWNKSRVTPTITNFLVLIFSIIAPVIVMESTNIPPTEEKQQQGSLKGEEIRCNYDQ